MIQEKYFNKERLMLAMMRRGLSCHGLAKLTKINPSELYKIAVGLVYPDSLTIGVIANSLNWPVDFFYGDDIEGHTFSSLDIHINNQELKGNG